MNYRRPNTNPSIRHRRVVREPNRWVAPIIIMGILALVLQMMWMQHNWGEMARRTDHVGLDPALIDKLKTKTIVLYECEHCLGSGLLGDPSMGEERELCLICFGVGYHPTRRYTDVDRMCLNCGGMGRHYNEAGEVEYCPRCAGRGIIETDDGSNGS